MLSGSSLPVGAPPLSSTFKILYPKEIEREERERRKRGRSGVEGELGVYGCPRCFFSIRRKIWLFILAFSKPFFFRYAAPRARSATHERSENKARGIRRNPLIAY